jgi:hypothetical protein
LFENEEGGPAELGGQDAEGLSLGVFPAQVLEIVLPREVVLKEADGDLTEGPLEVNIADLGSGSAGLFPVGLVAAFDEAGIGGEGLGRGKASDITDLVADAGTERRRNIMVVKNWTRLLMEIDWR